MPNENLKKMMILGLCLFFMVGVSACTAREFNEILASLFKWIFIFIIIIITLILGFRDAPKTTGVIAIVSIILIYFYQQNKIDKVYATEKNQEITLNNFKVEEVKKYKDNLINACATEQKIIVNKKLPRGSGIFISNNDGRIISQIAKDKFDDTQRLEFPLDREQFFSQCTANFKNQKNLTTEISNYLYNQCSRNLRMQISWIEAINLDLLKQNNFFKMTKASYLETLDNNKLIKIGYSPKAINNDLLEITIDKSTAPYELIARDISTMEDRNKGIRRGSMQLKNRKTQQILTDYITFDMIPLAENGSSSYNCLNLNTTSTSPYDIKSNYRYFFENAVE